MRRNQRNHDESGINISGGVITKMAIQRNINVKRNSIMKGVTASAWRSVMA